MMLKSPIIVLLIVLINLLNLVELKAQTGPGGIEDTGGSSDLTVWLDANKLSNSDGTNVSSWTDQSGYSNTASAPSGNEPVFHTNVLNSHPIIRFTAANNDYFRISDDASLKPAKISIFVVGSYTSNSGNGDGWGPFVIKTDNYHWTNGYGLARWDKNEKIAFFVNKYNSNFISSSMSYNTSTIMSAVYDKSNVELFYNETSQGTDAYSSDISNSTNYLYVGVSSDDAGSGTKSPLDGDIAEVIILKREVNKAERIIIDNYLSAKYSINISNDYYSYQATHSNDLVGIGRVDASNTHTASMSAGILQIENPSSMGNNEFLLFAHDNGSISSWTTTEAPSVGNIERIEREWRLDETGDVGTVDFKISNSNLPALNSGYTKYGVMVDADGDFSTGAKVYELVSSGSYYVVTGVSIDDGDYISIAAIKPTIEFSESTSSADESISVSEDVVLNYIAGATVSVDYATSDGSATSGSDYTATNGTLNITAGNSSNTISVSVTDDASNESNEDFDIDISSPSSGINLGSKTTHTHTIEDNDNARKINFDNATANGSESTTSVNVGLTITSADASNDTKVDYSVTGGTATGSGTDYTLADGTVTIPAGTSTTGSFTISINNDALDEDNETIIIELSNPVNCNLGSTTTHTYTINDDDATPTIQFHSTSSSGVESVATKNLQIDLSAASSKDVSVSVSTSGTATENTDYTKSTSTITITAGNTSTNLTLSITDDSEEENDETAIMTISGPTNATLGTNTSHTYTIEDNDVYEGPGGVGIGVRFWVKADVGVTSSGGDISTWADQTGLGNDATQATSAERPSISNVERNYQPGIYFDGSDENLGINDLIASDNTELSIIAVGSNETGGDTWHTMVIGQGTGTWKGGGYGLSAQNSSNTDFGFWVNDYTANVVKSTWSDKPEEILIGVYNDGDMYYYMNAKNIGSDSYSGQIGDNGTTNIGGSDGTDYNHKGYICEVAIYKRDLSSTDLRIINSYLAVKYGITLDRTSVSSNYYNSANTSIFTDGGTYWNDIIGIGRDDDATLLQKQSKQADDSTKIYISTLETSNSSNSGSFSGDNQFVVMGNNKDSLCATVNSNSEKPSGVYSRLEREWKVVNTGFSSSFSIDITLHPHADVDHVNTGDLRLLVDDDGDFSDATIYAAGGGLSFSYSKPIVTISGISTTQIASNSTKYITLASANSNTPLPIDLLNFNAVQNNSSIVLNWTTATEENNDYFTVEKSSNGIDFNVLGNVSGAGNSNDITEYSDIDYFPLDGINYYRLKQTDFDGKYSYSNIVSVDYNLGNSSIKIIPNPATDNIMVEGLESEFSEIHIFNIIGNDLSSEVYLKRESDNVIRIDLSKLSRGIYIIKTKSSITKFTKL